MKAKKDSILQQDPMENQSPASDSPTTRHSIEEEVEDLNASYSDTSLDGGGISSPPLRIIKVQRQRRYIKGKGWTSVVTHPLPKVEEIKELIGEIQNKQEDHELPMSGIQNGESSNPPPQKLQWVPNKAVIQGPSQREVKKK